MDGSDDICKNLSNEVSSNLRYVHMNKSVEQRLFAASKLIKTKYVLMSGDDDLFLFSGISKCINRLEHDHDLVSAAGTVLGFKYINQKVVYYPAYPNFINWGQIIQQNHWNRVRFHFKYYECSTIYAVTRSDVWIKVSSIFELQKTLSGNTAELFFEFSNAFLGKSVVINDLVWLRSSENAPQWSNFETFGLWLLKKNNPARTLLFDKVDRYILSSKSSMPSMLRKSILFKEMLDKQLEYLALQFNIKQRFRWGFLPVLFIFSNLNENIRRAVFTLVKGNVKSFTRSRVEREIQLENSGGESITPLTTDSFEIQSVTSFLEEYNVKHGLN
jgi:glycosyltransferase domain-containing protein